MSQLRAPVPRQDRREGGRHGRSGARSHSAAGTPQSTPSSPSARIRPHLLRTAVVPVVVATFSGAAAVLFTIRSAHVQPSPALWVALAGCAVLGATAVAVAALGADRAARSVLDRCHSLRRTSARGQAELRSVVEGLRRGERPALRGAPPATTPDGDEFGLLAQEMERSYEGAVAAVVQASRLSSSVGNEQKVEVFVNLARRLQSLVHREIQLLDELENEVEDPELLKGLFHVDHLATRIRRHAENLAVLGGAISRRQWSNPVTMTEVLRSSIAEVEQYPRVKLVPPIDGTLHGHAVADVIHLLAELVENATLFSAPDTQVLLRASHVTAGLAVEVEDRGLGMPVAEQNKMNALLGDPDQVNVAHLLQDGRIGLFVVSALARRHGIAVRLQSNIYGGIQAVLVLPQGLLGGGAGATGPTERPIVEGHTDDPSTAPAGAAGPKHAAPRPAAHPVVDVPHSGTPRTLTYAASVPVTPPRQQQPEVEALSGRLPVRRSHPERPPHPDPSGAYATGDQPAIGPTPPPGARNPPAGGASSGAEARTAPGGIGRPQLPKRRAQEHLMPQLRTAPAPRKPAEEQALHDPGLMAAFQRGIGLAESQAPGGASPAQPSHDPLEPHQQDDTYKE
ncbi:ATP-binding protein [Streptomyces sp. NPDC059176]|uniref:sensor histidine kinase n=1 Tax=Streptomyces sp. NPDC059176 TaxID=3346758 RepID=UPI003691DA18